MNASVIRTVRFDIEGETYKEVCLERALEIFRDMVNEMLEYGLENGVHSAVKLEKRFYHEFKERYGMAAHYATSASRFAAGLLKAHRAKLKARRESGVRTGKPSPPKLRRLCMRLQKELANIHLVNGSLELRVTTKPKRRSVLRLRVYPYAEPFIEAWRAGELRVGEVTVTESCVFVPFGRSVAPVRPAGVMFFDTNLNSLDFVIVTESGAVEGFSLDISLIQRIRERYAEKRARIQRISNPETRRRLFEKYREREKRRVNHLLHLASSIVAKISERYGGLYAVFGDLTEIRTHINKQHRSKRLRRRLNSWPFRRLQQLCEFKLLQNPRAGLAA